MNEILAACGGWVFVNVLRVHRIHKVLYRKPFACEVCMGGWFALVLNANSYHIEIPFRMAAAMVITILLTKIIGKV